MWFRLTNFKAKDSGICPTTTLADTQQKGRSLIRIQETLEMLIECWNSDFKWMHLAWAFIFIAACALQVAQPFITQQHWLAQASPFLHREIIFITQCPHRVSLEVG